jgi:predicted nucleic acid-binding protein
MNIYLDTNVYSYLLEAGEARKACKYFREINAKILVSDAVTLETIRVPKRNERLRRLKTVRTISNLRIDPPTPYREAMEILSEIRRCRPMWLEPTPDEFMVKKFLRLSRSTWRQLKYGELVEPTVHLPEYLRDAEPATREYLDSQRQTRQAFLEADNLELRASNDKVHKYLEPVGQTERYWRLHSARVWARALNGEPAMRDYKDFLGPYLVSPIDAKDWVLFWVRDVNGKAMPVGCLRSAIEFHQVAAKITHGNPLDTEHGVHLGDCDLLLTCDKTFFKVLGLVTQEGVPGARLGKPLLVPRQTSHSALEAIRRVVDDAVSA